jgi:RecB family exonuclease
VPLQVLLAKAAGQIIHNLPHDQETMNRTAVVLPDENLLMPVLYALPDSVEDINVTMGYPLGASPLFNLTESLFDLQKSFRQKSFYFKQVISLLSHPYIQFIDPRGINKWLEDFRQHPSLRIQQSVLTDNHSIPVLNILFGGFNTLREALDYFNRFFSMLIDACKSAQQGFQSLEKEYITYFYTRFKKLEEIILTVGDEIPVETFRTLFKEVILTTRIPFTGEPLKGLQVMGFLETRVLDFDNLVILSLNEDALPPAGHHPSFIPYNIRRAFGLPTFEDNNAISAYHFYRLLQRAKNIYLIYNTEVKNFSGGEKSRFLLQIENELVKRNPNIKLTHRNLNLEVKEATSAPVEIPKTAEVMKELSRFYEPLTLPLKFAKKFSASGLGSYIACQLQFYFRYIAKLKETREQDEYIEGGMLGTILHDAMHSLYMPMKQLAERDFAQIISVAEKAVDESIKRQFGDVEALDGKNVLMRNVLVELITKILEYDRKDLRSIKFLEEEFTMPVRLSDGNTVHLYGIIDRVDMFDGNLRIVDYKTGTPDLRKAHDIESLFTSPAYKEQFQIFFYSMLLDHREPGHGIKAGLFRLKKLSEGINYINGGEVIRREQFDEFRGRTQTILEEIFNPSVPFRQTEDETRCRYCAYKDICNR